jgi:hypothetical protein
MVRFEYKVISYDGNENPITFLNRVAEDGWEYREGMYSGAHYPLEKGLNLQ